MGEVGAGQLTKMVNQICIAGVVQGLAEGLHFAQKAGLDQELVIEVISKGAAQSWQMENRYKTMIAGKFDFGFAVDWMRKDLSICLDEARRNGAQLPVAALVDQFYADVQRMGGRRWDTSSLIARLERLSRGSTGGGNRAARNSDPFSSAADRDGRNCLRLHARARLLATPLGCGGPRGLRTARLGLPASALPDDAARRPRDAAPLRRRGSASAGRGAS